MTKQIRNNLKKQVTESLEKKPKKEVVRKLDNFTGKIKKGEVRNKRGNPNLPKGRPKGAKNHLSADIKEAFKQLIEGNLDNMNKWLEEVGEYSPKDALKILIDMTPFVVPKLANTEIKVDNTQTYDLSRLTPSELDNLIAISEKASISDNYNNQIKKDDIINDNIKPIESGEV